MPGRNKKRVNYKRLNSKGRSPGSPSSPISDTVDVEIDIDDDNLSDIDDGLAAQASALDLNAGGQTVLDESISEDDIDSIRTQIEGQERRLRQVLLRKELAKLRETFRKNEEALEREAAESSLPAPTPRASAPSVVRRRAPVIVQQNAAPSTSRRRQNVRQIVLPDRVNVRQAPTTHQGECDIDGFNSESENYIVGLIDNDNKRSSDVNDNHIDNAHVNSDIQNTVGATHKLVGGRPAAQSCAGGADVRSGMGARSLDRVKSAQHWAHAALPGDFQSEANTTFADLDFRRLVAGEVEIIIEFQLSQAELEGRLRLLRTLACLYGSYPWTACRSVYAAVLRRIELGKMTWSSDISETMSFALLTYAGKQPVSESRPERQDRSYSGKRNVGSSQKSGSGGAAGVWYCGVPKRYLRAQRTASKGDVR